jgi:uncharacterized membrane protein SpoIIM required for sporulation
MMEHNYVVKHISYDNIYKNLFFSVTLHGVVHTTGKILIAAIVLRCSHTLYSRLRFRNIFVWCYPIQTFSLCVQYDKIYVL